MMQLKGKFLVLAAVVAVFAVGCDDDDDRRAETLQQQGQVESGTYAAERCYKNKIATQTALEDRYSLAELTINGDTTGSFHYRNFSDANCTTQVADETVTFERISTVQVGTTRVLRLEQNGSIIEPNWFVPTAAAEDGYYFEVDYADGDSGPYLSEPSAAEIDEFATNPAAQGVRFVRQ